MGLGSLGRTCLPAELCEDCLLIPPFLPNPQDTGIGTDGCWAGGGTVNEPSDSEFSGEPLRLTFQYSPGSGGDRWEERQQLSGCGGGEGRGACDT